MWFELIYKTRRLHQFAHSRPEAAAMLRELRGLNIVGADVVEVSPPFDPSGMTAYAGVVMMFEIMCSMAEDVARRR